MELRQQFEERMEGLGTVALATSVENQPNVRIISFAYDKERADRLFFTTFKGSKKVEEFQKNSKVTCILLPAGPEANMEIRIFGKVKKSDVSIDEVVSIIEKKQPRDAETIKAGGSMIDVYEVHFEKVNLTVGMTEAEEIKF